MTHKNFQNKMQLLLGALLSLGAALSPTADIYSRQLSQPKPGDDDRTKMPSHVVATLTKMPSKIYARFILKSLLLEAYN